MSSLSAAPVRSESSFRGEITRRARVPGFLVSELRHRRPSRSPTHEHGLAYVSLLSGGSYLERDGTGQVEYRVGAARYHPASYRHGDEIGPGGARFLCLEIAQERLRELPELSRHPATVASPSSEVSRLAGQMRRELRCHEPGVDLVLEGLALQLVGALLRMPVEDRMPAWLRRVSERLRAECHLPLKLADLAASAGVHPVHLSRAYRRHFGQTAGEELRRRRVEVARAALSSPDSSIADIAADAGFADQSHMSRVFRRLLGVSPAEYRKRVLRRAEDDSVPAG